MARQWMRFVAATALIPLAPGIAFAEAEPAPCTAAGILPPELSAWSMLAYHDAAAGPAMLDKARLTLGETARVTLVPMAGVHYRRSPEKPGAADSYGGLMQLAVTTRGTYRVVLGAHSWVDLIAPDGGSVTSVAHSMGPACTGIRKMVDFTLNPGTYTLQISGNPTAAISVLVLRNP